MKLREHNSCVAALRLAGLFATLSLIWVDGCIRRPRSFAQRAQWANGWCRRLLRFLRCRVRVSGSLPPRGLIAANHISYVDVIVLGALAPAIFVAKSEVRGWPLIGAVCERGGVIFLDRSSPRSAAAVNRVIAEVLRQGVPVVVFPEGTTSDGSDVLPLHAALFQSALQNDEPIVPATLSYGAGEHAVETRERIAYWGDATLVPHLLGVLRLRSMEVCVSFFTATGIVARHRGQAAALCQAAWRQMLRLPSDGEQKGAAA